MNQTPEPHSPDLREYLRIARARKLQIGLVTLVLVAAAMLFTFRQTPVYQGEAKVLVRPVAAPGTALAIPQTPNLDTERELVLSQKVANLVKRAGGTAISVDELQKHLGVQVLTNTEVLVIRFDDPNPQAAARFANAFADRYIDFRSDQARQQFQDAAAAIAQQVDGINKRLSQLRDKIDSTSDPQLKDSYEAQRDELVAQLGVLEQRSLDLTANQGVAEGSAEVVQRAEPPRSPVSPNKVRNAVLALLAGLALGVGFAFLRERLDDRVKTRQEVERRLGAPVIAAVPRIAAWRRPEDAQLIMRADPRSPVSEAYRTLSTNVQYMASQSPIKVIMVTSAMGGDGKTTTCANLAMALAQAGKRVVLVSADLRRPRLHHFFGLRNGPGLSNTLSDPHSLAELAADPGVPNLRVVNAGEIPQDPAALLGSPRASRLLTTLREAADFVLIDTPPVLAVADASILAPLVDGTIFVLDAGHSSRSALAHARDQLDNAGARILGAVFNNFDPTASGSYPYYYYYYHYQYRTPEEAGSNGHRGKLAWRPWRKAQTNGHAGSEKLTRSGRA